MHKIIAFTKDLKFSLEADPNYKPVFSASESSSKSPLKTNTAVAKKFDSAHKKQFSRYVCTHLGVQHKFYRKGTSSPACKHIQ